LVGGADKLGGFSTSFFKLVSLHALKRPGHELAIIHRTHMVVVAMMTGTGLVHVGSVSPRYGIMC